MSRIGNNPVKLPPKVEVSINALKDVLAAEQRSQEERGVSRVEVMA